MTLLRMLLVVLVTLTARVRYARGYAWGRRIVLAATLAATAILMTMGFALAASPDKYMW